jgi:cytoskeletal protein RodZ
LGHFIYNFREMPTIGQELKRERELRGVSLSDISKITKIKLNLLQAMEDDRLNILPGEFFIKGMIRAYAKCIGLDEDQALNLYHHSIQQKEQDQAHEKKRKETPILRSRKPNTPLIVAAVVVLLAVSLLIIFGFAQKKGPASAAVTTKPPASAAAPAPTTLVPAAKPEAKPQGLVLRISFQQDTWIQVYADGTSVLNQVEKAGELVSLTCKKEFVLNTGNAGGFTYTLDGRPAKPLGRPGDVVKNVRIGLDNYREYLGAQ